MPEITIRKENSLDAILLDAIKNSDDAICKNENMKHVIFIPEGSNQIKTMSQFGFKVRKLFGAIVNWIPFVRDFKVVQKFVFSKLKSIKETAKCFNKLQVQTKNNDSFSLKDKLSAGDLTENFATLKVIQLLKEYEEQSADIELKSEEKNLELKPEDRNRTFGTSYEDNLASKQLLNSSTEIADTAASSSLGTAVKDKNGVLTLEDGCKINTTHIEYRTGTPVTAEHIETFKDIKEEILEDKPLKKNTDQSSSDTNVPETQYSNQQTLAIEDNKTSLATTNGSQEELDNNSNLAVACIDRNTQLQSLDNPISYSMVIPPECLDKKAEQITALVVFFDKKDASGIAKFIFSYNFNVENSLDYVAMARVMNNLVSKNPEIEEELSRAILAHSEISSSYLKKNKFLGYCNIIKTIFKLAPDQDKILSIMSIEQLGQIPDDQISKEVKEEVFREKFPSFGMTVDPNKFMVFDLLKSKIGQTILTENGNAAQYVIDCLEGTAKRNSFFLNALFDMIAENGMFDYRSPSSVWLEKSSLLFAKFIKVLRAKEKDINSYMIKVTFKNLTHFNINELQGIITDKSIVKETKEHLTSLSNQAAIAYRDNPEFHDNMIKLCFAGYYKLSEHFKKHIHGKGSLSKSLEDYLKSDYAKDFCAALFEEVKKRRHIEHPEDDTKDMEDILKIVACARFEKALDKEGDIQKLKDILKLTNELLDIRDLKIDSLSLIAKASVLTVDFTEELIKHKKPHDEELKLALYSSIIQKNIETTKVLLNICSLGVLAGLAVLEKVLDSECIEFWEKLIELSLDEITKNPQIAPDVEEWLKEVSSKIKDEKYRNEVITLLNKEYYKNELGSGLATGNGEVVAPSKLP